MSCTWKWPLTHKIDRVSQSKIEKKLLITSELELPSNVVIDKRFE